MLELEKSQENKRVSRAEGPEEQMNEESTATMRGNGARKQNGQETHESKWVRKAMENKEDRNTRKPYAKR